LALEENFSIILSALGSPIFPQFKMCGIAGIIGRANEGTLRKMTGIMRHRGPDDEGLWLSEDGTVGLGHRRLSILDLSSAGHQPMVSEDGNFVLTFNGELFNFRELRHELEGRGRHFKSQTDTEVLLQGYAEWGEAVLGKLVGQFAFAVWDRRKRTLFSARDHLGIKPFYYLQGKESFYFASEAKAIHAVCPETRRMNMHALPQYLAFLWVPGTETMFADIRKLEPGCWLRYREGCLKVGKYWDLAEVFANAYEHADHADGKTIELKQRLFDAVRGQLISDVPLGLLLSGGLDSTILLSLMKKAQSRPRVFTATYSQDSRAKDVFDDDLRFARVAANTYGAEMHEALLEPDLASSINKAVWHLDEPLADPTVLTNLELTRQAKPYMTVLLTGMGADELFAGYPRCPATLLGEKLRHIPRLLFAAMSFMLQSAVNMGVLPLAKARRPLYLLEHLHEPFRERFIGYSSYFQKEKQASLFTADLLAALDPAKAYNFHIEIFERVQRRSPLQQMLAVDLLTFLPYLNLDNMDKTSMANSVEMRVPFLDHRFVEFSAKLPDEAKLRGGNRKAILREAFFNDLPAAILRRKKTGYCPPIRGWMHDSLHSYVRDLLLSQVCLNRGFWHRRAVETLLKENQAGTRDHSMRIWILVVLEEWMRTFVDSR
jgi:asparagine synthase (glutamine-hydrolysing)